MSGIRNAFEWPGFLNARDLGGHPTLGGSTTRFGAVVWSDTLTPMGDAARSTMVEHRVRAVVDLRLPEQVARNPSPFAASVDSSVLYHSLPPIDSSLPGFGSLERQYRDMVRAFSGVAPAVMAAIGDCDGTAWIHCEYGKDRTGLVSALLLDLAGVSREFVAEDYAMTAVGLRPIWEDFLASDQGTRAERKADLARFMPRREVILDTMDLIDREYGDVKGYLQAAGISTVMLTRVRDRLVGG